MANSRVTLCFYGAHCMHPSAQTAASFTRGGVTGSSLCVYGVAWNSMTPTEATTAVLHRERKATFSDSTFAATIPRERGRRFFELRFSGITVPMYAYKIVTSELDEVAHCPPAYQVASDDVVETFGSLTFRKVVDSTELSSLSKRALLSMLPLQTAALSRQHRAPADSSAPYMVWYCAYAAPGSYTQTHLSQLREFYATHGLTPFAAPADAHSRGTLDAHEVLALVSDRIQLFTYYTCGKSDFEAIQARATQATDKATWSLAPTRDDVAKLTAQSLGIESPEYVSFPLDFVVVQTRDAGAVAADADAAAAASCDASDEVIGVYASNPQCHASIKQRLGATRDLRTRPLTREELFALLKFLHAADNTQLYQMVLFERHPPKTASTAMGDAAAADVDQNDMEARLSASPLNHTTLYRAGLGTPGLSQVLVECTPQQLNPLRAPAHVMYAQYYAHVADRLFGEPLFRRPHGPISVLAKQPETTCNLYAALELLKRCALLVQISNLPFHVATYHLGVAPKSIQLATAILTREFRRERVGIMPWPSKQPHASVPYRGADVLPSCPGMYVTADDQSTLFEIDIMSAYASVICEYSLCYTRPVTELDAISDQPDWNAVWTAVRSVFRELCEELPCIGTERVVGPAQAAQEQKALQEARKAGKPPPVPSEVLVRRRIDALNTNFQKTEAASGVNDVMGIKSLPVLARTFARLMRQRRNPHVPTSMRAVFKLAANALYGSIACTHMRYYCVPISRAATTACRREITAYRSIYHSILPWITQRVPSVRSATFPIKSELNNGNDDNNNSINDAALVAPCAILASQTDSILIKQAGAAFRGAQIHWLTRRIGAALRKRWVLFGEPIMLKAAVLFSTNNQILVPVGASSVQALKFAGTEVNSKSNTPGLTALLHEVVRCMLAVRGVQVEQRGQAVAAATTAAAAAAQAPFVQLLALLTRTREQRDSDEHAPGADNATTRSSDPWTSLDCRALWRILESSGTSHIRTLATFCLPDALAAYGLEHVPGELRAWLSGIIHQSSATASHTGRVDSTDTGLLHASASLSGYLASEESLSAFATAFELTDAIDWSRATRRKRSLDEMLAPSEHTSDRYPAAAQRTSAFFAARFDANAIVTDAVNGSMRAHDARWWESNRLAVILFGDLASESTT